MNKSLPKEIAQEIYQVLVEMLDAYPGREREFLQAYSDPDEYGAPTEFRFGGRYGMAGKFWWNNNKFYSTGYGMGEVDKGYWKTQEADLVEVNMVLQKIYDKYRIYQIIQKMKREENEKNQKTSSKENPTPSAK